MTPTLKSQRIKALHQAYKKSCVDLLQEFEAKQKLEFSFWIGNEIGGSACFIDYYVFSIDDIVLDLTTNQPKGFILKWQDAQVLNAMENNRENQINYQTYISLYSKKPTKNNGK